MEALVALHDQEIVHGDIKPSNVMLTRNGTAKLIDIGSAMDVESQLDSKPQCHRCTPIYASIEVLSGEKTLPGSDLVSLGYLAMELLTGKSLFAGADDLKQLIRVKHHLREHFTRYLPDNLDHCETLVELLHLLLGANEFHNPGVSQTDSVLKLLNQFPTNYPVIDLTKNWVEELWDLRDQPADEVSSDQAP